MFPLLVVQVFKSEYHCTHLSCRVSQVRNYAPLSYVRQLTAYPK